MAEIKRTKEETMICKTLHRQIQIEQRKSCDLFEVQYMKIIIE